MLLNVKLQLQGSNIRLYPPSRHTPFLPAQHCPRGILLKSMFVIIDISRITSFLRLHEQSVAS